MKVALQTARKRLYRGGLGKPGRALDQQVAVGQQRDEQTYVEVLLPDDAPVEMGEQARQMVLGSRWCAISDIQRPV